MQEEIFAPILPVIAWRDRAEAVEIVRRRSKPLALYVYAKDRAAIDWFLAHQRRQHRGQSQSHPVGDQPAAAVRRRRAIRRGSHRRRRPDSPNFGDRWSSSLGLLDTTFNFPPYSKTYRKLIEKALG